MQALQHQVTMTEPNPFDIALEAFDEQMESTGFVRREPITEPDFPKDLSSVESADGLKLNYDTWIRYYLYLANEVALNEGLRIVVQREAKLAYSQAYLRACMSNKLKNDASRKAGADCDELTVQARAEETRVIAVYRALTARLKAASKAMDRIGRELYYRTGRTFHQDGDKNRSGKPWAGHGNLAPPTNPRTKSAPRKVQEPQEVESVEEPEHLPEPESSEIPIHTRVPRNRTSSGRLAPRAFKAKRKPRPSLKDYDE